jgi:hypothetical protein
MTDSPGSVPEPKRQPAGPGKPPGPPKNIGFGASEEYPDDPDEFNERMRELARKRGRRFKDIVKEVLEKLAKDDEEPDNE